MTQPPAAKILLTHLDWSLQRLDEAIKKEKTEYYRDAALERFGFTHDLVLKLLRAVAKDRGKPLESPGECFEWAAESNWIDPAEDWPELLESCEKIRSSARKECADAVYPRLQSYLLLMKQLHAHLAELYSD